MPVTNAAFRELVGAIPARQFSGVFVTRIRVSEVLLITRTLIWALIAASDPNEGSPVYTPQAPGEEDAELVRARCNESNQFVPHYLSDKPERAC